MRYTGFSDLGVVDHTFDLLFFYLLIYFVFDNFKLVRSHFSNNKFKLVTTVIAVGRDCTARQRNIGATWAMHHMVQSTAVNNPISKDDIRSFWELISPFGLKNGIAAILSKFEMSLQY